MKVLQCTLRVGDQTSTPYRGHVLSRPDMGQGAGVRDPYRVDVLSRPQGQDRDQIRIETCPQVDGALAVATTPCHARGPGAWAGGVAPRSATTRAVRGLLEREAERASAPAPRPCDATASRPRERAARREPATETPQ